MPRTVRRSRLHAGFVLVALGAVVVAALVAVGFLALTFAFALVLSPLAILPLVGLWLAWRSYSLFCATCGRRYNEGESAREGARCPFDQTGLQHIDRAQGP